MYARFICHMGWRGHSLSSKDQIIGVRFHVREDSPSYWFSEEVVFRLNMWNIHNSCNFEYMISKILYWPFSSIGRIGNKSSNTKNHPEHIISKVCTIKFEVDMEGWEGGRSFVIFCTFKLFIQLPKDHKSYGTAVLWNQHQAWYGKHDRHEKLE